MVHGLAGRSTTRIWCAATSALYADGSYAPKWYQRRITRQVHELAEEYGIGPAHRGTPGSAPPPAAQVVVQEPTQLSLL